MASYSSVCARKSACSPSTFGIDGVPGFPEGLREIGHQQRLVFDNQDAQASFIPHPDERQMNRPFREDSAALRHNGDLSNSNGRGGL